MDKELRLKLAQELRRWADTAHPAWQAATDAGEDDITMFRAFVGVGIDLMLNTATLLEVNDDGGS